MNTNFQTRIASFLKIKNISKEELQSKLTFSLDKEAFTLEEICELSYNLDTEISQLFTCLCNQDIYNTLSSFCDGIKSKDYPRVKRTILAGKLVNVEDKLYFNNRHLRIVHKNALSTEMADMLFKLLLDNNDYVLARMLSSKDLYYKFNKIESESYLNYLLGDTNANVLEPDCYAAEIYKALPIEDKKVVEKLLINNYSKLADIYTKAVQDGLLIDKTPNLFTVKFNKDDNVRIDFYFIDDVYNSFNEELKAKALEILKPIIEK